MIGRLTATHEAMLTTVRDEWIAHGLCTRRAARARAEFAVAAMYSAGGLAPPARIMWCDSPLSMMLSIAVLRSVERAIQGGATTGARGRLLRTIHERACADVPDSVRQSVWHNISTCVSNRVEVSVREYVRNMVLRNVSTSVASRTDGRVWFRVWSHVSSTPRVRLWEGIHADVWSRVWGCLGDGFWAEANERDWGCFSDGLRRSVWGSFGEILWAGFDRASWFEWHWGRIREEDLVLKLSDDGFWDALRNEWDEDFFFRLSTSTWPDTTVSPWDALEDGEWDLSDEDGLWHSLGESVRASGVPDWASGGIFGQHAVDWLAPYAAFARLGLEDVTEPLSGLWELAKNGGWAFPTRHTCWLTERHSRLVQDDDGRLHCTNGSAVEYPDGFSVYAIHGVRIDSTYIEHPEQIRPETIAAQANGEVRRVLLGLYGEQRYLNSIAAQVVATDTDALGQPRTLYRAHVSWSSEPLCMVRVLNATRSADGSLEPYFLRVPPNIQTPADAVAWTFNMSATEYAPTEET